MQYICTDLKMILIYSQWSHHSEYSVKQMEGLSVGLHGLGPLNWIGKKVGLAIYDKELQGDPLSLIKQLL